MVNKIRTYIVQAFEDVPQTKNVLELKEELIGNLIEKYNDYLKDGKTENEAYIAAISGIGDITELVESMKEANPLAPSSTKDRQKHASFISIAIALYILSIPILLIFAEGLGFPVTGVCFMFLCIAIATGLIIYSNISYKSYTKLDESLVEDFKAYRAGSDKQKAAYHSFKGAFWSAITALYFLVSFIFEI